MNFHDIKFEVKALSDPGMFEGMGSVYGNVDEGMDVVAPGCFSASLNECQAKGRLPAMLWQHNSREPIGTYKQMTESEGGLFVKGQLCLDTQRGAEAYALMKMGALSGLSIGFQTREESIDQKTGVRTIKQADLWEVSPVTFPMNDSARISAVKSIEEIGDFKSACDYLRNACGCSRSEATAIVARLKNLSLRNAADESSAELKAIVELLEKRQALMV